MSLKIQEQQSAVAAASPVEPVPLSERVQARQPQPTAQQAAEQAPPRDDERMPAPDDSETDTALTLEQTLLPLPQRDVATVSTVPHERSRLGLHVGHQDLQVARKHAQAEAATPALPGNASRPLPTVATPMPAVLPGNESATPPTAALVDGVLTGTKAPAIAGAHVATAALQPALANGALLNTEPAGAPSASAQAAAGAVAAPTPSRSPSAQGGQGGLTAPGAVVGAPPAAGTAPPAAGVTDIPTAAAAPVPSPVAERPAVPDTGTPPTAAGASVVPQQHNGEAAPDGQSMADARRAEANLGTRQHVRAVRQAEALQTAMVQRADTASHINVSFNSWGAGHSVSARLDGGRLYMQPSSARVGQALSSALAPPGAELQIAVESSDSATDERRRRGDQGHA
ncbi:hypothetical protein [Stenotrophomonas sp. AB1(2024)]|uniref:SpaN/EivJ family type III secretion system needle length determinant n=1 Tax=Stenotrophomonas sp. AB1(2024) TaxID=3132215 RepID=UPI0030ADE1E1